MGKNRTPVIGVMINQINGRYQTEIRYGLSDFAQLNGVTLRYFVGKSLNSPYGSENEQNSIYTCAETMDLDAVIICTGSIGAFLEPPELAAFVNRYRAIPIVTIGIPVDGYPCIMTDNSSCIEKLVRHLIHDHEYRRIAYLSGPSNNIDAQTRKEAFLRALKDEGGETDPQIIFDGDFSYSSGSRIARELQNAAALPFDALVCANDDMAFGFIDAMRAAGVFAPKDYAITGVDDIADAQFYRPPLTTINQSLYMQGYGAAQKALELISGKTPLSSETVTNSLVRIRESCGCTAMIPNRNRRIPPAENRETPEPALQLPCGNVLEALALTDIPVSCSATLENAVTALYNQLALDIRTFRSEPLFILTLNEWFDITAETWKNFSGIWEQVLQKMQNQVMGQLSNIRAYAYTENVFMHALSLLTCKINKVNAAYILTVRKITAASCEYSSLFAQTTTEQALHTHIQQLLATFNLPYLDLCCHKAPLPCSYAKMECRRITPSKILKKEQNHDSIIEESCLIMPLICSHRSFGYVVIPDKAEEPLIYELIREMISQGLAAVAAQSEQEKQKTQQEKERQSAALLQKAASSYADSIPLLIIETDLALHIATANKAARDILKLAAPPGCGEPSLRPYLKNIPDSALRNALHAAETAGTVNLPEIRITAPEQNHLLPVLRIEKLPPNSAAAGTFRWSILEPLPIATAALLPDDAFFRERNISRREKEIILYMLQGLRIRDIAGKAFIAESTVKGHLSRIYDKLDVKNRSQLCDLMRRNIPGGSAINAYIFSLLTGTPPSGG